MPYIVQMSWQSCSGNPVFGAYELAIWQRVIPCFVLMGWPPGSGDPVLDLVLCANKLATQQ
jgi:hypothetical protein